MNKKKWIEALAREHRLSQATATKLIDSVFEHIVKSLEKGETARLRGFGTFTVSDRSQGNRRHPKTGELITLPAKRAVLFRPGKELRRRVAASALIEDEKVKIKKVTVKPKVKIKAKLEPLILEPKPGETTTTPKLKPTSATGAPSRKPATPVPRPPATSVNPAKAPAPAPAGSATQTVAPPLRPKGATPTAKTASPVRTVSQTFQPITNEPPAAPIMTKQKEPDPVWEQHLFHIRGLRDNTTYLWRKLAALKEGETALVCKIREASHRFIAEDLSVLKEAGYFSHSVSDDDPRGMGEVLDLRLWNISTRFKKIIAMLAKEADTGLK